MFIPIGKLQGWTLNAIISEYRLYAGTKVRHVNEQCVELFDLDLVSVPMGAREFLPDWFVHLRLFAGQQRDRHEREHAQHRVAT